MIIAVIYATFAVARKNTEKKIQAFMGFERCCCKKKEGRGGGGCYFSLHDECY